MSLRTDSNRARPSLSVVIPTYRRLGLLERCVNAVMAQAIDPQRFEIIVVDDGHDDVVQACVAASAAAAAAGGGPCLRYLRPAHGRGPAVARNCGWRAARGEIVAFTDDDTVPDPGWLKEGEAAPQGQPVWSALCGRIRVPLLHHDRPTDDERFTRAWREDSDLQFRLMAHVGPVGTAPNAVVLHPARTETWGVCLRQQRNAFFDALLYKKHPALYRSRIHPNPPWNDDLIVGLTVAMPLLLWAGAGGAAATSALVLVALWLQFSFARLLYTTRRLAHVVEMLTTSALIPFLSVYWRLRGAIRFRVLSL